MTMETKIKITHAREVYQNASVDFLMGANAWLTGNYDERMLYQETGGFKAGYWQAREDLKDNYEKVLSK